MSISLSGKFRTFAAGMKRSSCLHYELPDWKGLEMFWSISILFLLIPVFLFCLRNRGKWFEYIAAPGEIKME